MGWLEHVANGEAYSAEDFILGSPGLYPHLQLFNPAGSGKRIRLRSVHAIDGLLRVNVRRYDPPGAILGPPAPFIIENLLSGGPAAVAELRHDNIVIPSGTGFWLANAPNSITAVYPVEGQEWGIDLLENTGVLMQGPAGTILIANWMWVELDL